MTSPAPRLPDLSVLFPFRAWLRHPALRAWTTWLFVALIATPPLALVMFPESSGVTGRAVMFAAYFAVAWFLVLWVVVRPQRVTPTLIAQVVGLEIVIMLSWRASWPNVDVDSNDLLMIFAAVSVPEEIVKVLPAVAVAMLNRRLSLAPRDVLFLAAASGLVFGAVEAVLYVPIYVLVNEPMTMVWRFAAGPIGHALWAGIAGYFAGIATGYRHPGPWFALAGLGVGVPAVLHGLSNWTPINSTLLWVLVEVVSALLFLAYARVGLAPRTVPTPPRVGTIPPPRDLAPRGPGVRVEPPTAPIAMATRR